MPDDSYDDTQSDAPFEPVTRSVPLASLTLIPTSIEVVNPAQPGVPIPRVVPINPNSRVWFTVLFLQSTQGTLMIDFGSTACFALDASLSNSNFSFPAGYTVSVAGTKIQVKIPAGSNPTSLTFALKQILPATASTRGVRVTVFASTTATALKELYSSVRVILTDSDTYPVKARSLTGRPIPSSFVLPYPNGIVVATSPDFIRTEIGVSTLETDDFGDKSRIESFYDSKDAPVSAIPKSKPINFTQEFFNINPFTKLWMTSIAPSVCLVRMLGIEWDESGVPSQKVEIFARLLVAV